MEMRGQRATNIPLDFSQGVMDAYREEISEECHWLWGSQFQNQISAVILWDDAEILRCYGMTREALRKDIVEWRKAILDGEVMAEWQRRVEAADPSLSPLVTEAGYAKKPIPAKLRWAVFKRDNYRCAICKSDEDLTADHAIAEARGGLATLENLQTLCRRCNSKKGAN